MGHPRRDVWRVNTERVGHQGRRDDAFYRSLNLLTRGRDPRAEAESAERQADWTYIDAFRADKERYAKEAERAKAELAAELARYAAEAAAEKAAAAAAEAAEMIKVKTSDGVVRQMKRSVARACGLMGRQIEEDTANGDLLLPNVVKANALDIVIEYCLKHADESIYDSDPSTGGSSVADAAAPEDLEEWDRKLVEDLRADDLYELLLAANYLGAQGLADLCESAADMIKGKTARQIPGTFDEA